MPPRLPLLGPRPSAQLVSHPHHACTPASCNAESVVVRACMHASTPSPSAGRSVPPVSCARPGTTLIHSTAASRRSGQRARSPARSRPAPGARGRVRLRLRLWPRHARSLRGHHVLRIASASPSPQASPQGLRNSDLPPCAPAAPCLYTSLCLWLCFASSGFGFAPTGVSHSLTQGRPRARMHLSQPHPQQPAVLQLACSSDRNAARGPAFFPPRHHPHPASTPAKTPGALRPPTRAHP